MKQHGESLQVRGNGRSRSGRWGLAVLLASLAAGGAVLPATADWLVTHDGKKVETAGAWQVKGRLVVFTLPNGTLSSLRASEVNLEASRAATEEAKAPKPVVEEPAPLKKAPVVITDKDIKKHVDENGDVPAAGTEGVAPVPNAVDVESWSELKDPETSEIQILGTLKNSSTDIVTNISVVVRLWGADRALVSEQIALLNPNTLAAGGTTNFRAAFPGISGYETVTFEVTSSARGRTAPGPEKPPETSASAT